MNSVKRIYVSIWETKVSIRGIRLKEKIEDNIPIAGFESHRYSFMGDYFLFVGEYFPFVEIISRLWEIISR